MTDLKSKKWIVAKGVMFFGIASLTAALILLEMPSLRVAAYLILLVWASCRFYYFLFYVLEHYVDPTMRYAGLWDLMLGMKQRREKIQICDPLPQSTLREGEAPAEPRSRKA